MRSPGDLPRGGSLSGSCCPRCHLGIVPDIRVQAFAARRLQDSFQRPQAPTRYVSVLNYSSKSRGVAWKLEGEI